MAIKQIFIPEDKSQTYKLIKEGYNIFFMDLEEIQETKKMCVSCGQGKVQTFSEILVNDNSEHLTLDGTVLFEDEISITEEIVTDGKIIIDGEEVYNFEKFFLLDYKPHHFL